MSFINVIYRTYRKFFKRKRVDIISYPKSGRTWLSFMIGTYFIKKYGLNSEDHKIVHELVTVSKRTKRMSTIHIHHDGLVHNQTANELIKSKERYKGSKVVFLVRDPRDVLVSIYFEKNKRIPSRAKETSEEPFLGTIQEFINHDRGSIDTIIEYMNIWYESKDIPKDFLLIKYEDLRENTTMYLKKILDFVGETDIDERIVGLTVQEASFNNMRKLEKEGKAEGFGLKPANSNDVESFKTRKGIVGGYKEYFNEDEITLINSKIKNNLNPVFDY